MKIISETPPKYSRQLRHTIVEGGNGKFYAILTQQLYDRQPHPEFPNYEVAVNETDINGKFKVLVGIYLKRFCAKEDAVATYQKILDNFDELLNIPQKQEVQSKPSAPKPTVSTTESSTTH